jgi:hypothetical protein
MNWSLDQLRQEVERAFGREQRLLLEPCVQSVADRLIIARYHHDQAEKLINDAVGDKEIPELVGWMLGSSNSEKQNYAWVRLQSNAHVIACIQSVHCLADTLAHTVYFGMGLNLNPMTKMRERSINARNVIKALHDNSIKAPFLTLLDHANFLYLDALVNRSKHRSIVAVQYSIDLGPDHVEPPGLKFAAFEHDGKAYPNSWVKATISGEYKRQDEIIRTTGRALNDAVAAMPAR